MPAALLFVIYLLALVAFVVVAAITRRAPVAASIVLAVGLALFVLPAVVNAGQAAF